MNMKYYKCGICGQIIMIVKESGVPVECCGEPMKEIIPGSTDTSAEKHVPVYDVVDGKISVMVGSTLHPMTETHYIEWIAVETNFGIHIRFLKPGGEPRVSFQLNEGESVEAVLAFCNLHSLWKSTRSIFG
ncbi:MAG: desulfoferrodoxin family protein [Eubacteriales bacterium]|nr:desulfoferrodoxin family protein [Eubacteriales bacterium]